MSCVILKVWGVRHTPKKSVGVESPQSNAIAEPLTKREGAVQKVNQYGDAGEQVVEISFITEGDVYRLIVHSKLPSAERFEHWVFDEVLPSIRKHGVYMSDSILNQVIQHP